jgi:iron complex transport system ATP-binding protein
MEDTDAQVSATLDRLGLGHLADADVRTLSGGERQRLALATALLQEAPLLLLDEPASHLDPAHQRLLLQVLREHAVAGGAVVASLHDLNLAWDLASHAVLLDGRGGARVGSREQVFDAHRLGSVFGVTIEAVRVGGSMRFLMADAARPETRRGDGA